MRVRHSACLSAAFLLSASLAFGQGGIGPITTGVAKAKKRVGTPPTAKAPGFKLKVLVSKEFPLENPVRRHHFVRRAEHRRRH